MYDYNRQYKYLRENGISGWGGETRRNRGFSNAAEPLDKLIEECVLPKAPVRMLELGCGNGGVMSELMARRGYRVYGVDISEIAVEWARERFAGAGLRGEFHRGDVCAMPIFDDGFLILLSTAIVFIA